MPLPIESEHRPPNPIHRYFETLDLAVGDTDRYPMSGTIGEFRYAIFETPGFTMYINRFPGKELSSLFLQSNRPSGEQWEYSLQSYPSDPERVTIETLPVTSPLAEYISTDLRIRAGNMVKSIEHQLFPAQAAQFYDAVIREVEKPPGTSALDMSEEEREQWTENVRRQRRLGVLDGKKADLLSGAIKMLTEGGEDKISNADELLVAFIDAAEFPEIEESS